MRCSQFTLVLGGKNLGKTLIRNQTVCEMENEANAKVTIVDVNMRERPSQELFDAILDRVAEKDDDWASILKKILRKVASSLGGLASAAFVGTSADKVAAAASTPISSATTALIDRLSSSDKEKTLSSLIGGLKGNATCIVVDEANLALPVPTDSESARRALQYFVMLTKETGIASVVLISSELGYPYRLQACGMNLQDITNIITANEVPKEEMLELMVNPWNMSEAFAEAFFTYCGGDVNLCCRGVKQLQRFGDAFDPFVLLDCPGLQFCRTWRSRAGLPSMTSRQTRLRSSLLRRMRVASCQKMQKPSMRWKIARELERVDSMGARNLDALLVEQTQFNAVFSHFACFRSQGGSL